MSLLTTLTRNWLTRSTKPFVFKNVFDNQLDFELEEEVGLYVRIPFCRQLCSFCPFYKELYDPDVCNEYLDYLIQEIHLIGSQLSRRKYVTSLHIIGGTPALAVHRIGEIIKTMEQYFIITEGIWIELHPEDVTEEILTVLHDAGVTKIKIGIQSFSDKYDAVFGQRNHDTKQLAATLQKVPFDMVSVDLAFALPDQTIEDIKSDMETAFSMGANHITLCPFIDSKENRSTGKTMTNRKKRKLMDDIALYCQSKGYIRDSLWTFTTVPKEKYDSVMRENFLGFGCGATSLLLNQFNVNTFSIEEYQKRIAGKDLPTSLTLRFTNHQRMIYYLYESAYSTHVDPRTFKRFFGDPMDRYYGFDLWLAKKLGLITEEDNVFHLTLKGLYYLQYIEYSYTLSYVDNIWSLLQNQAFPGEVKI